MGPSTTQPSLLISPKTGNLNTLPAAPSMGKLKELFKQRITCYRGKMTLRKPCLAYRSTPFQGGKNSSELLFGRQIRCTLNCLPDSLQPSWPGIEDWKREESERKMKQKHYYAARHGVKELHPLQPVDHVWTQGVNKPARVRVQQPNPSRNYTVEASGGILQRNRSALLPYFQQPTSTENNHLEDDISNPEGEPAVSEPERLESPKDTAVRTRSGRFIRPPKRLDL